jgi:hypothetical protein
MMNRVSAGCKCSIRKAEFLTSNILSSVPIAAFYGPNYFQCPMKYGKSTFRKAKETK